MKRSFQLEGEQYQLLTTYQPSHIHLQVRNKQSGRVKSGLFYDSTLPEPVRQECEAVSDLYDFLEGKGSKEIQVDEEVLRFKVVHIKKERWYSLEIEQDGNGMEEEKALAMEQEKERLETENKSLKDETVQLRKLNNDLLQLLTQQRQKNIIPQSPSREEQQNYSIDRSPRWITPVPDPAFKHNPHYRIEGPCITKLSDDSSRFNFCPLPPGESVQFGVKIVSKLMNNWIILGVTTEQGKRLSICYFQKNCIAFSGSMGLVFNELQVIDLHAIPSQGDCLHMKLIRESQTIEWCLNSRKFHHRMSSSLWQLPLSPFLMLAGRGDSIVLLQ